MLSLIVLEPLSIVRSFLVVASGALVFELLLLGQLHDWMMQKYAEQHGNCSRTGTGSFGFFSIDYECLEFRTCNRCQATESSGLLAHSSPLYQSLKECSAKPQEHLSDSFSFVHLKRHAISSSAKAAQAPF